MVLINIEQVDGNSSFVRNNRISMDELIRNNEAFKAED